MTYSNFQSFSLGERCNAKNLSAYRFVPPTVCKSRFCTYIHKQAVKVSRKCRALYVSFIFVFKKMQTWFE